MSATTRLALMTSRTEVGSHLKMAARIVVDGWMARLMDTASAPDQRDKASMPEPGSSDLKSAGTYTWPSGTYIYIKQTDLVFFSLFYRFFSFTILLVVLLQLSHFFTIAIFLRTATLIRQHKTPTRLKQFLTLRSLPICIFEQLFILFKVHSSSKQLQGMFRGFFKI
jgi:hypothetical protein